MANTKISALTALTGANLATDDRLAVVDTSATATKSITTAELKLGIMPAPGPIGATTPSTGAFTTLSATGNATVGSRISVNTDGTIQWGSLTGSAAGALTWDTNISRVRGATAVAIGVGADIATVTATGLAVTGTISATSIITPGTFTTGTRPAKTLGGIIFDTTLNKLLIGGVSAWEVVTSI